jgi:hypothetical protein
MPFMLLAGAARPTVAAVSDAATDAVTSVKHNQRFLLRIENSTVLSLTEAPSGVTE